MKSGIRSNILCTLGCPFPWEKTEQMQRYFSMKNCKIMKEVPLNLKGTTLLNEEPLIPLHKYLSKIQRTVLIKKHKGGVNCLHY